MSKKLYWTCPFCNSNLDFGEKCDCLDVKAKIDKLAKQTEKILDPNKATKEKITSLLLSARKGPGMKLLVDHMEKQGFFKAPCSTQYHLCKEGGLAGHSLNVYETLVKLNDGIGAGLTKESMIVCALLHDLGKMGDHGKPNYVANMVRSKKKNPDTGEYDMVQSESKPYESNKNLTYEEHEIRSILIAERFIHLTEEEETAILHHNGLWGRLDSSYGNANYCKTQLAFLLHTADMYCSRFIEREDD